ncbi:MAG TPA: PAS domain S-box protein [Tepidisphaeraceae bacterium]|nr:PAS domain S-box protein [Tepidisphaeraceae bacterium]
MVRTIPVIWRGYLLATAVALLSVLGVSRALGGDLPSKSHLLPVVLGIVIAAYFGGTGPGIWATALSTCTAVVALGMRPLAHTPDLVDLALLGALGITISTLVGRLHAARREAAASSGALRVSETRYRHFVEQSSEGIWRFEVDEPIPVDWPADRQIEAAFERGYLAECNDAMARMYGFDTAAQLVGARLKDLLIPTDEANRAFLAEFVHSGYRITAAESHERDQNGNPKVFVNSFVGTVENGLLTRAWGTQVDVTDRWRAEQRLRASEELLRLSAEAARVGPWSWTPDVDAIEWSPSRAAMNGRTAVPRTLAELLDTVVPADRQRVREAALAAANGSPLDVEFRSAAAGGEDPAGRWVRAMGRTLKDRDGTVRLHGVTIDVDDHKRAEATVAASEARFRALIEQSTDLISVSAADGRVAFVSPSVTRICGYSPEEFRQVDPFARMPADDARRMRAAMEGLRRQPGGRIDVEHRYFHADGSTRWIEGTLTNLLDDPTVQGIVGNFRDVTDRIRFESDLERAKDQAEASRALAETARADAELANREKDRFLAVLSHELRTPLTPVLTTVQSLEADPTLGPDIHDAMAMIRRNVELEARLIDDLLDLTRIARGKLVLATQPVDVHAKLRQVIQNCDPELRGKQIELAVDLAAAEPWAQADPARLQQVFWNLLKNAVKFTPAGGRVTVRTSSPAPGRLRVTVADDGIGIDPHHLGRIFDAFEQGDQGVTRKYGGLGLGLAICKALVDLHNGAITAASAGADRGATFTVELDTCAVPASIAPTHELPAGQDPRLSILLVEDHEDTARAVARLLRGYGWQVRVADTVASAVQVAGAEEFDLLISDIGLPDGSGLDLMRQLLARKPTKGICLSGFGMEEDVRKSRDAGFLEHLTKPVNVSQLKKAIIRTTCGDHPPLSQSERPS